MMKMLSCFFLFIFLLLFNSGIIFGQSSLLEYWFDEGTGSSTKSEGILSNSGTLMDGTTEGDGNTSGPIWSSDVPLVYDGNHSLYFDGANDNVNIGVPTSFPQSLTIEAWIKPENKSSSPSRIFSGDDISIRLELVMDSISCHLVWTLVDSNNIVHSISSNVGTISFDTWQHVAGTYDPVNGQKLYINDSLVESTSAFSTPIRNRGYYWRIGYTNSDTYEGYLDELRIYSKALTPGKGTGINELAWNSSLNVIPYGLFTNYVASPPYQQLNQDTLKIITSWKFNDFTTIDQAVAFLDSAYANGVWVIIGKDFTSGSGSSFSIDTTALHSYVSDSSINNNPALYGWLAIDEPAGRNVSLANLQKLYQAYREADPNHPVMVDFNRSYSDFGTSTNPFGTGVADIANFDIYPWTIGAPYSLNPVSMTKGGILNADSIIHDDDPHTKIWGMGQTFSTADWRRPLPIEMYSQAVDFLTNGAQALDWYTWSSDSIGLKDCSDLQSIAREIGSELESTSRSIRIPQMLQQYYNDNNTILLLHCNEGSGSSTADSSSNKFTGTLGSNVSWQAWGRFGAAVSFNGTYSSSSFVTIPNNNALNPSGDFTIEAWVKPNANISREAIVSKVDLDGYFLYIENKQLVGMIRNSSTDSTYVVRSVDTLGTQSWHHVAMTFDTSNYQLSLWVDGFLDTSIVTCEKMGANTRDVIIGAAPWFTSEFNGYIDEVRISNSLRDFRLLLDSPYRLTKNAYTPKSMTIKNNPFDFNLSQNYPNPFNPSTTIRYSLARQIYVNLRLYNILGQVVTTLVHSTESPGLHSIIINADKLNLASGVYFYRIVTNGFVDTKKLILIK
ncbi:MAG: LamG-like jellyroll fold domain-containing protein [Ignavibacteriaceae bacterium]